MTHEPRLSLALKTLLATQRTAALGTLDEDGHPFVSMVPFAHDTRSGALILHVSALAPHSGYMANRPTVALMVKQAETPGEPVHALPRVSLECLATLLEPDSAQALAARAVYLARFPEAEPMTALGDFRFVALKALRARQVAGFGAARALDAQALAEILASSL